MMKIEDLSFRYGDKQIFSDLSLVIPDAGACIMGPSGRGKTTLLFLIGGLLIPERASLSQSPKDLHSCFRKTDCSHGIPYLKM